MAGNAVPQFTRNGNLGSPKDLTTALTRSDGTGVTSTTMQQIFAADGTNGSYVDYVRIMPWASAASTATTATIIRIYYSTDTSGSPSPSNTHLIAEQVMPSVVADSPTIANVQTDIPLNMRLPAGSFLLASTHAAPATNTGWRLTAVGGDY